MVPGNPFVYVVHSIMVFNDPLGRSPYLHSKAIGFLGDRVGFTSPEPVLLPQLAWTVQEVDVVEDAVPWVRCYADAGNRLRFYMAAEGATTKRIKLPYLLHLPHVLTNFILTQQRTCNEVVCEVSRLSKVNGVGVGAEEFNLVLSWLTAASHRACHTKPTSNLAQSQ